MTYFEQLSQARVQVVRVLKKKEVDEKHLNFGGTAGEPEKKPRPPIDARSEFLANRAMGDWAEDLLAASLRNNVPSWQISHFGETSSIAAGEAGFKEHYLAGLEEVRLYGKRPDLLVFDKNQHQAVEENLSIFPFTQMTPSLIGR